MFRQGLPSLRKLIPAAVNIYYNNTTSSMGPIVGGPKLHGSDCGRSDDVFRVETRRSASPNEAPGSTSGELSPP